MEQDYHNKKWGVEDFERYHSGKMPDLERHALEKATLDDPFLEDALEGYAYTKTGVSDIEELRNKLAPKKEQTKIVWYKQKGTSQFLKIAAILIFFGGFAWLLTNNKKERKDEIASVSTKPTPAYKADKDIIAPVATETTSVPPKVIDKAEKKMINEQVASTPVQDPHESKMEEMAALVPTHTLGDSQATKDIAVVENINLSSREKRSAAPSAVNQALEGNVRGVVIVNQNNINIRGRVVDDEGQPVAFANINDKQNNVLLAADKDGYFSLNNRQNAPNVKVDVNAVGFEPSNVALNAGITENKIVLKESKQALSEVVVTGYGSRKKSAVAGSAQKLERDFYKKSNNKITLVNALPVDGWESFNKYINDSLNSKKMPESGYREVTILFNLDSLGKAQDISVKKSVSDSLDTAAKQILKSLPALRLIRKEKKAEALIRL